MPGVTTHAVERFIERVSTTDDPKPSIVRMWEDGREPRVYEYSPFRVFPYEGTHYRICAHNGATFMLIERDNCIVTIVAQMTGPEIAKVRR